MDAQIAAALIQAGATGVAALVGFGAIIAQMRKQSALSRQAILDAESRKIRSQMLDEGIAAARAVADGAIDFTTAIRSARVQIEIADVQRKNGEQLWPPSRRIGSIMDAHNEMVNATLRFIFLLEHRRIIDHRIILFRDVVNTILHDLREIYNLRLIGSLMTALPNETPSGEALPYSLPPANHLHPLYGLIDVAIARTHRLGSVMEDFIVEIQNLMLSDVFKKPVMHREPADPEEYVIRLDRFDEINARLRHTPWGKLATQFESEAKTRFQQTNEALTPPAP